MCYTFFSNQPYFGPFQPGSCARFSQFLLCANHTCVLVWVCLYIRVQKCVIKVININKHKQNRDDITCNVKVDIEMDVHSAYNKQWSDKFLTWDRIQY